MADTPSDYPEPDEPTATGVDEALSSLDRGRRIPYEKVREWLLSWGTDKELPPAECL